MKKSVKILLAIAAALVIAGLFAGETILVFRIKNKNEALDARIEALQTQLDGAKDTIGRLEKADQEALKEKDLVESVKSAMRDYLFIDSDEFNDAETVQELLEAIFNNNWYGEIHEIWDGTAVVEAYRSGSADGLSEEDAYVLETASAIIDEIITDGMSDYEKELAVYNWQVKYVRYDEDHFSPIPSEDPEKYNYYPYGVLKYHSAICVGNATTFKLFMDLLEIDCKIIHSTTEGEHAWNLVCLDDEWYHVDVTFDGGYSEPDYAYFNVPDSFKIDGGYPWDPEEFPAAEGYRYCYGYMNAVAVKDKDEIPQLIKDRLDNGGGRLYLKSEKPFRGVGNMVDDIADRLDGNAWVWLDQDGAKVGEYYLYTINIEYADIDFDDNDSEGGGIDPDIKEIIGSIF